MKPELLYFLKRETFCLYNKTRTVLFKKERTFLFIKTRSVLIIQMRTVLYFIWIEIVRNNTQNYIKKNIKKIELLVGTVTLEKKVTINQMTKKSA